jgi:putative hydrolase of the HAD superfamily
VSAIDLVIFDLWKTLVPLTDTTKVNAFAATAAALGEDPQTLDPVWRATRELRETTELRTYLVELGSLIGHAWSADEITQAMRVRRNHHVAGFRSPLADAIPCLRAIRDTGAKIAVISNGSSDVAGMLAESPLAEFVDHAVISGVFGVMKPERAIYAEVSRVLDVPLDRAVYVGDGQDSELEGARDAGCRAVLVDRGSATGWRGPSVPDLSGVTALLDSFSAERQHS